MARLEQKVDDGFGQMRTELRGVHQDLKIISERLNRQDERFVLKSTVKWLVGTAIAAAAALGVILGVHHP